MEQENKCKYSKHIRGVLCDVKNCEYHDGDCYCSAEQIAVGPTFASSSSDTVCATFKQSDEQSAR